MAELINLNDMRSSLKLGKSYLARIDDVWSVSSLLIVRDRLLESCELTSRAKSWSNRGLTTITIPEKLARVVEEFGYQVYVSSVEESSDSGAEVLSGDDSHTRSAT